MLSGVVILPFHHFVQVVCAHYHKKTQVLTVGFTNGVFALYELPDFNNIHSLSISQKRITSLAVNPSGEWLAFASAKLGQLLVWEWQSESYILKQQGHFYDMNVVSFSPNGQYMATGGDDGKVKLWSTTSGFCVVTFKEHTGRTAILAPIHVCYHVVCAFALPTLVACAISIACRLFGSSDLALAGISAVTFIQNGLAVLTASLDGTVRAFDTTRYRNFRTLTSPQAAQVGWLFLRHLLCYSSPCSMPLLVAGLMPCPQFGSLAVDSSGELVCAGCIETFEIYVWSLPTGKLLDILSGHMVGLHQACHRLSAFASLMLAHGSAGAGQLPGLPPHRSHLGLGLLG